MTSSSESRFVISLDSKLMWGVRDVHSRRSYGRNILGVREAIFDTVNPRRSASNPRLDTADTWCREEKRRVSNDGVISYQSPLMALKVRRDMPARAQVVVRTAEDGTLRVIYRVEAGIGAGHEHQLEWKEHVAVPAAHKTKTRPPWTEACRPAPDHPWRLRNRIDIAAALEARAEAQNQTSPG
jgi:hypothetical protein